MSLGQRKYINLISFCELQDKQTVQLKTPVEKTRPVSGSCLATAAGAEHRSTRLGAHVDPRQIAQPLGRKPDDSRSLSQKGLRLSGRQQSTGHQLSKDRHLMHSSPVAIAELIHRDPSNRPGFNARVSSNIGGHPDGTEPPVLLGGVYPSTQRGTTHSLPTDQTGASDIIQGKPAAQAPEGESSEEISVGKPNITYKSSRSLSPEAFGGQLLTKSIIGQGMQAHLLEHDMQWFQHASRCCLSASWWERHHGSPC
jgi:hypothetical protein